MIIKLSNKNDPFKEWIESFNKKYSKKEKVINHNEAQEFYKKLVEESLPQLKLEINEVVNNLITNIKSCDAVQILEYFGVKYSFSTPNTIIQDMDSDRNFKLDYIHSLVTAVGVLSQQQCEESILNKIDEDIEKIKNLSGIYLMLTSDNNGLPNEIKFSQSIHNLIVRGDSYPQHKIEMCRELFSKFDDVLKNEYGITSQELIDELIAISEYPLKNIEIQKIYFYEIESAHKEFVKKLDSIQDEEEKIKFIQEYKDSKEAKILNEKFQEIYNKTGVSFDNSIFKIHKTLLPKKILDQISMQIGDNKCFQNGQIKYFPINNTLIYNKPLMLINDEYYCFNPALIIYNLHTLLENIILNIIPLKKHQKNYYKKKGEYLEDKALKLFQNILPNCKIYKNLKYNKDDEVDGIVIYDNNIFIIEAKSNKFTEGAKKGDLNKIKRNTKDIVEKAYQQAIRTKRYILSKDKVNFRDRKTNKVILRIEKNKIKNIYLINVTLEPLNNITTNLTSLKEFGFIQDEEWIWSVYINDLRIISEILDSPSEFLLYVDRRIRFNDYPQIKFAEEIDIFGYFLSEGLYFYDINFPQNGFILHIDNSFSKDIDLFYAWKEGVLANKYEKPKLFNKCKNNIKFLVQKIEKLNKENFTLLTTSLLSLNCKTQSFIKENIEKIVNFKINDFSFPLKEKNVGVTFINKKIFNFQRVKQLCELYAYQHKIGHWFVVIIGNNYLDFKKFYFENKYNKMLKIKLEKLKQMRFKDTLIKKKKIGRNDLCPCGSGKKYKKCCLNNRNL